MDNLKYFLKVISIALAVFMAACFASGAYLDAVSILFGGTEVSLTNPLSVRLSDGTNYVSLATSANQTTIINSLNSIDAGVPAALGQNTMANSMSVAIASNQSVIPVNDNGGSLTVDATSWPLPTGAATDRTTAAAPFSSRLTDGTSFYDARQIRTLTSSDIVSAQQNGGWTVTANLGTISTAATAANQTTMITALNTIDADVTTVNSTLTAGNQKTRITSDGTNDAAVVNVAPSASAFGLAVRPITLELATYSVVSAAVTVGNNKSMIALQNTGTQVVRIREIWIINDQTSAVTGVAGLFEVRRITSFTGGTAITPIPHDTADTLPGTITASTGATVAGEGVLFRSGVWSTDEWGPGTADTESFDHAIQQVTPFFAQTANGKPLVIRQNQGVTVKFATNSTAGTFNIRLVFTVE